MRAWTALFLAMLPLLTAGCRQGASAHTRDADLDPVISETYTQVAAADATQSVLPPTDLALKHQEKGVALGLQIDGRTFRAGQNIPMVVVYEDVAASIPISSTDCAGFSLSIAAVDQGKNNQAVLEPCLPDQPPANSNEPLVKGSPRFLHTSLFAARQELTQPGKYLIRATWQSYRPKAGDLGKEDAYARVHSNVVPIAITR